MFPPLESGRVCDLFNQESIVEVTLDGFQSYGIKGHAVSILFSGKFTVGALSSLIRSLATLRPHR